MANDIVRTTILVTVLHHRSDAVADWDIQTVIGEMNEGCVVGSSELLGSLDVTAPMLVDALQAVGNDGSFFDEDADWMTPQEAAQEEGTDGQTVDELVNLFDALDMETDELDERVIEAKCNEASSINNAGVEDQIRYLVKTFGVEYVQDVIAELAQ